MKSENFEKITLTGGTANRDDRETTLKEEPATEASLEKLRSYSERIFDIAGEFESVYSYLEPKGLDPETQKPRGFKVEKKDFIEKRKTDLEYCPNFYYEELKKLEESDLRESIEILDKINEDAFKENDEIRFIISETIAPIESKIKMLIDAKRGHFETGDLDQAFRDGIEAYGDIDPELCEVARKKQMDNLEILKNKPEKSVLEQKLEEQEFNAEDIKEIMEFAIRKGGLENEFKVVIEKGIDSINVTYKAPGHPYNVVLIPEDRKMNGIDLPKKIAHEMTHVVAHSFSPRQGIYLGGRECEIYTEGIAQISEEDIMKYVLGEKEGEEYINSLTEGNLHYILAMEKAKEGGNFAKVYDYIFEIKYQEEQLRNRYHLLEEGGKEAEKAKEKSREKAETSAMNICKRVFRGFNPKEGGKYFTKDMVYFKGKVAARKMVEAGEDKYLYMSRIDPKLIPGLKELGAYASERGLELARSAVKKIWKERGWVVDYHENKEWFADNIQMDRHWAYAKEFLEENLKDQKSDRGLYEKRDEREA